MPDQTTIDQNPYNRTGLIIKHIPISRGQYIEDIMDELPTDAIINKTLTGIHATSKEIETARNSILLESNVPVIINKRAKYPNGQLIGVYKNLPDNLEEYLRSNINYKKIMVTPESFNLVMSAMKTLGINPYKDYFFLWDEAERTIQDIAYRGKIILPMDDFFKFEKKCFISATTIPPSDLRFQQNKFTYIKIQPDFDYKQDLKLLVTNNVVNTLKQHLKDNPSKHYFIFANSTRAIASLQKALNIKRSSHTFCGQESILKLKLSGFSNCSMELKAFKKHNFFTSRFFSAVDIEFKGEQPHIIILTDLVSARHSMVDPFSEAVQIVGRFRKVVGSLKHVVHITNTDPEITHQTLEETEKYLEKHEFLYNTMNSFLDGATDFGSVSAIREVTGMLPWNKYLTATGSVNEFMKDNTYFEEKVKGYYNTPENLAKAYTDCGYFNMKVSPPEVYQFDDRQRHKAAKAPLKNITKMVMSDLQKIESGDQNSFDKNKELEILKEYFPVIIAQYEKLGYAACEALKFNNKAIEAAVKVQNITQEKSHFEFIQFLNGLFLVGKDYASYEIETNLNKAIRKFRLFRLKANTRLLRNYFELSDRKTIGYNMTGSDIKGYTILAAKFNN